MRKYSSELTLLSLIAIVAVGAIGYFLYLDFTRAPDADTGPATSGEASRRESPAEAHESDRGRTGRILTCTAADGSVFYTNAATCEEADLGNRVTVVPTPEIEDTAGMGKNCLSAGGERVHQFLANCNEPFNEALRIEQRLAMAEDPVESSYAEEYCALIAEGVRNGCMATNAQFCYLRVCQIRLERESEADLR